MNVNIDAPHIDPPNVKAQPLFRIIVEAIQHGRIQEGKPETFLAYSDALHLLGVQKVYRAGVQLQRQGLSELNDWTQYYDIPKVAALIVNKKTFRPSGMFWKSHDIDPDSPDAEDWWMEQANESIRYDWKPYLRRMVRYPRKPTAGYPSVLREENSLMELIVTNPPPAHLRESRITVGEILRWLASGKSETDLLREHKGLRTEDIRASLAYAASREEQNENTARKMSKLSSFIDKWGGKFTLPKSDPDDPRMDYLLEKYWRNRS